MEEREIYQLPAEGKMIDVTEEQYHAFYKYKRREKYLEERDKAHNLQHYSDLDTDEILGEEMFSYPEEVSVEEQVVNKMLLDICKHHSTQTGEYPKSIAVRIQNRTDQRQSRR